ncbi:PREDICTED: GTPase Era, mitochondrial-like, partial [Priapulus caudatus]|uniref:GTPase Era, mitochondrial n=1 Tax=Priapulus caudatus TaxID=37621 RepID=A0ABM1F4N4_PRICU
MAAPINVTMLLRSIGNFAFGKVRGCSVLTLRLRGCMSTSSTRKDSSNEGVSKPVKRSVGRTADEQLAMMRRQPTQPDDPHMLSVAIIGTPNTGKSTLTNKLVGWRICSVSKRVHTTRRKTLALIVEGNTQIRILDTPGLISKHHGKKHHLETSLILDPERSLEEADQIAVMVDVTNSLSRCALDFRVLRLLHLHPHKKSILILNKIDLLRSRLDLLTITRTLTRGTVGSHIDLLRSRLDLLTITRTLTHGTVGSHATSHDLTRPHMTSRDPCIDLLRSRLDLLTITRTLTCGTVGSHATSHDLTRPLMTL